MNTNTAHTQKINDWKGWIVFIFLGFIWGGSFILIKKGLLHFAPAEVGALRIFLSALAFVPLFIALKIPFPTGTIRLITLVVLTGNGVPAFLYALAQTRLGSAVTGVLNSLTPIFALLIGVLFFQTPFKKHYLIGLLLGCAGIGILVIGEQDWRISSYVIFVIIATMCYGLSANLIKRYCQDVHPVAITAIGFSVLGFVALGILLMHGTFQKMMMPEVWQISMPSLLALALICTVLANILFYWLIQRTTAVFGSAIAYAIPCMALVWGSLDGEPITWYQLAGFGFIIAAVYSLRRQ